MHEWIKTLAFIVQKGFGVATGFVGLKLLLFEAKFDTQEGLLVAAIGAVLLCVASVIEYLVWRETAHILDKQATKQLTVLGTHLAQGREIVFKDRQ
jgi:hypothetical protein